MDPERNNQLKTESAGESPVYPPEADKHLLPIQDIPLFTLWTEMQETYRESLFRLAYASILNRKDADDIVNEVFIRVFDCLTQRQGKPGNAPQDATRPPDVSTLVVEDALPWLFLRMLKSLIRKRQRDEADRQPTVCRVTCDIDAIGGIVDAAFAPHLSNLPITRQAIDSAKVADAAYTVIYLYNPSYRALLEHIVSCDRCASAFEALVAVRMCEAGIQVSIPSLPADTINIDYLLLMALREASAKIAGEHTRLAVEFIAELLEEVSKALNRAVLAGNDTMVVDFVLALHRFNWWCGRSSGLHQLDLAERAATRAADQLGLAHTFWAKADLLRRLSLYLDAQEAYTKAASLYNDLGDGIGRANCLKGHADVKRRLDDYPAALQLYEEAVQLYERNGDLLGLANSIKGQAETRRRKDDLGIAVSLFTDAEARYEELGDRLGVANCQRGKAEIYRTKALTTLSLSHFERAKAEYEKLGARLGVAHALRGSGDVYWKCGLPSQAVETYIEAEKLYEDIYNEFGKYSPGIARTLFEWAETCLKRKKFEEARKKMKEARAAYLLIGSLLGKARCLRVDADIFYEDDSQEKPERLKKALRRYQEALRIYRQIGSRRGEGDCLRGIAHVYQQLPSPDKPHWDLALQYYVRAASCYEKIDASLEKAFCLEGQGNIYMAMQRYKQARECYCQQADILRDFEGQEGQYKEALKKADGAEAEEILAGVSLGAFTACKPRKTSASQQEFDFSDARKA